MICKNWWHMDLQKLMTHGWFAKNDDTWICKKWWHMDDVSSCCVFENLSQDQTKCTKCNNWRGVCQVDCVMQTKFTQQQMCVGPFVYCKQCSQMQRLQMSRQQFNNTNVQHNFRLCIKTKSQVSARRMLLYVNDGESYDVDEPYMFINACLKKNIQSFVCCFYDLFKEPTRCFTICSRHKKINESQLSVKFMIELHPSPHAGLTDRFNMIPQKGRKSNGTVTASFLENISQLFQISFAINTCSQTTIYIYLYHEYSSLFKRD